MKFKVGDRVRYCKNIEDPYNECAIPLGTEGTIVEILGYENCNLFVEYEVNTGTATVSAVPDAIDEADETVVVDISAVSAGASESGTQQATVTILDDDATPTVTLSVSPATLLEDGSDSPATLTATLSGATTVPVTVDLAYSGTATLTDDYTRSGTQITIPALGLTGTATVSAVQDLIDEVNETVVVDISAVSAGASESGTQQVTVTILDDDATPAGTLSVRV